MTQREPLSDEELEAFESQLRDQQDAENDGGYAAGDGPYYDSGILAELVRVYREHRDCEAHVDKLYAQIDGWVRSALEVHDQLKDANAELASRPPCWSLPEGGVLVRVEQRADGYEPMPWRVLEAPGEANYCYPNAAEMQQEVDEYDYPPNSTLATAARLASQWEREQGDTDA